MVQRTPRSAQERLANPWWRLRHSAWMLGPLLGLGALSWVGLVYVAARTRRTTWIALAAGFFVAGGVAAFWPVGTDNTQGGLLVFVWAAAVVTAFIINPSYLRWRAGRALPTPTESAPVGPQDTVRPHGSGGQARGPVFGPSGRWENPGDG